MNMSLLVIGYIVISTFVSFAFYFSKYIQLRFIAIFLLFAWSSSVFFLLHNYEGWPTKSDYPRSRIISIEINEPTETSAGRIFVWVYHVNKVNKRFYEYNPDDTPRAYELEYNKDKADKMRKAKSYLEKGFTLYIGKNIEGAEGGEPTGKKPNNSVEGDVGSFEIPYETDKPPIEAINPRSLMIPKQ